MGGGQWEDCVITVWVRRGGRARAGFMMDVGELNQNIVSEGGRPEGVMWLEALMVTMLRR